MATTHQVLKNCGNFSMEVMPGMLAYGQEKERGRSHIEAATTLPHGDGYVAKEGDVVLGGFVQRQAAQLAVAEGRHLSEMTREEKQKLALKVCSGHMTKHGASGPEYYKHWMKRAESFAAHHRLQLPDRSNRETNHEYFRRVRRWTMDRDENWPQLRSAVGTHLVFSPDPKIWVELREAGIDERKFLHLVLTHTMKELSDWRRKVHGPGHSMGWVAGSHVDADGADKHPHIHVFVLKRDEAGSEVDWSVSVLKGRKGREEEPDQLRETKRLFKKNVEKAYERMVNRGSAQAPSLAGRGIHQLPPPVKRFALGLRAAAAALWPYRSNSAAERTISEIGALIRIARAIYNRMEGLPTMTAMQQRVVQIIRLHPQHELEI